MKWETIVAAVGGAVIGGVVTHLFSLRLQAREHEHQRQKEEHDKAEAEEAWRRSVRLNTTQREVLQFCRDNLSQRYNLQVGSGTHWLVSVDTDQKIEIPDMTIGGQLHDMEGKGYIGTLLNNGPWHIFELTEHGREPDISEDK